MPNSLVQAYRDQLAANGQTDPATDDQLTIQLGNVASAQNAAIFEKYPDFAKEYGELRDQQAPSIPEEFSNAMARGARSTAATLVGGVAALTNSQSLRSKALALQQPDADEAETIPTMGDIAPGRFGAAALFSKDALRYAAAKAGGAIPAIGEGAATAAAGAALGSALEPGGGTIAGGLEGAAEGFLERGPIKAAIRAILESGSTDGATSVAEQLVKSGTIDEASEVALQQAVREGNQGVINLITKQAKATARRRGENSLNALNAYLQGAGSIYNETPDQGSALGLGAIAAIPNTIIPHMLASKLFPDVSLSEAVENTKSYIARAAIKTAETGGVGGSAGAIQEAANIIAKNLHAGKDAMDFDKDDWSRIREAGVAGAIGGALAGPVVAMGGKEAPEEKMPAVDPTAGKMEPPPEGSTTEVPEPPKPATSGWGVVPDFEPKPAQSASDVQEAPLKAEQAAPATEENSTPAEPDATVAPTPSDEGTAPPVAEPAEPAGQTEPAQPAEPAAAPEVAAPETAPLPEATVALSEPAIKTPEEISAVNPPEELTPAQAATVDAPKNPTDPIGTAPEEVTHPAQPAEAAPVAASPLPSLKEEPVEPFSFGKVDPTKSIDFRKDDRLANLSPQEVIAQLPKMVEGILSTKGNRSDTRGALVLRAPDGHVVKAGITVPQKLNDLAGTRRIDEPALQRFSENTKDGAKTVKTLEEGGTRPAPLEDVLNAGYKPIAYLKFDEDPGTIFQKFSSEEAFNKTLGSTLNKAEQTPAPKRSSTSKLKSVEAQIDAIGAQLQDARGDDRARLMAKYRVLADVQRQLVRQSSAREFSDGFGGEENFNYPNLRTAQLVEGTAHTTKFKQVMARLESLGMDIRLVSKTFFSDMGKEATGATSLTGWHMVLSMEDAARGTMTNLVTLMHEATHSLVGRMTEDQRARVVSAAQNLLNDLRTSGLAAAEKTGVEFAHTLNAEDLLAESLGQRLTAEGIPDATSMAKAMVRWVKDVYYRAIMAFQAAFGLEPSDKLALDWVENNLRRETGGDFDYSLSNMAQRFVPEFAQTLIERFPSDARTAGTPGGVVDFVDPITWKRSQPAADSSSLDGLAWNLKFRSVTDDDTARSRMQVAAINKEVEIMRKIYEDSGTTQPWPAWWKVHGKGDLPEARLAKIEAFTPGLSQTKIGDKAVTPDMEKEALMHARIQIEAIRNGAITRAATKREMIDANAEKMLQATQQKAVIENNFRDADMHDRTLRQNFKTLRNQLVDGIQRNLDLTAMGGSLAEAVREAAEIGERDNLPENFKTFLSKAQYEHVSFFNYLREVGKLDLDLASMKPSEIVRAIRSNAEDHPTLLSLTEDKPLLAAVAALAHDNADQVDLIHLGRIHNTAEFIKTMQAVKEVQDANEATLRGLSKKYVEGVKATSRSERIRQKMIQRRMEFRRLQDTITKAQGDADALDETTTRLTPHVDELQQATGAYNDWQPGNGQKYTAMVMGDDGSWTSAERTMVANSDGTFQNADQIDHDRVSTREWLKQNREKYGTESYMRILKQNDEMGMIDHRQKYMAHQRGFMDRMIQPVVEKLKGLGGEAGARAAQMMYKWQAVPKDNWKAFEVQSRWWTKAWINAQKEASLPDHAQFKRQIYDPVMFALGQHRGLSEEEGIRLAVRTARSRLIKPEGAKFADTIGELVRRTRDINDSARKIAEKNGVFVDDERISSGMRNAVNRGFLTVMRKVDSATLQTITRDMLSAGWRLEYSVDKSGPVEKKSVVRATTFDDLKPSDLVDGQQVRQDLADKFTPGIISRWLEPFMNKPGAPIFSYDGVQISQLDVGQAWAASAGDIVNFMDGLAKQIDLQPKEDGENPLPEFRLSILKQLDGLFGMESKLAWDAAQTRNLFDAQGGRPHIMMDARINDSIPSEHLSHQMFDPSNARTLLGVIGFHAAFGRNGENMVSAIDQMRKRTEYLAQQYRDIATHVYDPKQRAIEAESRGLSWKELEGASRNQRDVDGVQSELEHMFGFHNQSGPLGDISGALKALSFVTGQIVNNPKTGLFNTVSLFNRPLIQRDLSANTIGASADAAFQFARGVLGQMFSRMGLDIIHQAEYAVDVSNVERGHFAQLPIGVALADIGKNGNEQHGWQEKWMIKPMNRIGDFQRWTGLPGIGGIMNFISQEAAVANGVANVRQFERLITRGIEHYQNHPEHLNDPTYRFTAKDLGMNNVGGFGSEGVFDYYKRKAIDYRVGNLEDIAREALQRQSQGERLLTTEQALGVSMMAANELNMEASVNTRIGAVSTNPILKYGMPLLGWPIQQMNAVNQALKTVDGQRSIVAATKTLGRLAAWSLPVGVAFSIAMDEYDEKLLGKKSNVAPVDSIAGLPIAGPLLAVLGGGKLTPTQNLLAMFERQARAGTYGLAGDFITGLVSPQIDPSAGQRAFSLDDRVLVFSQIQTVMQTINNLVNQHGQTTYATVWQPLARALGGNGVLHSVDLINNALGLDNQESRMTQRTNAQAWLRAAGRETGQELQSSGGEISSPTPMSPWIREMQLASYANDRLDFQEAYRKALEAARQSGDPDPAAKVLSSWRSRNPLNVFRTKPDAYDMAKMYSVMDPEGQQAVRSSLNLYQQYTAFLTPGTAQRDTAREIRQDNPSLASRRSAVLAY